MRGQLVVGASGEDSNAIGINGNQADNSAGYAGAVYAFHISPDRLVFPVVIPK